MCQWVHLNEFYFFIHQIILDFGFFLYSGLSRSLPTALSVYTDPNLSCYINAIDQCTIQCFVHWIKFGCS